VLTVFNDLHLGAIRSSGTTAQSAIALRSYGIDSYIDLLQGVNNDVMLLGDWLDTYNIPMSDVLKVYWATAEWLAKGYHLYAVNGNHDLSKSSENLSSMEFLCKLLGAHYPYTFHHVAAPTMTPHGYVIPHLTNQQEFDDALAGVPACDVVYTHCNISNEFAKQADHSLNMTIGQLNKLPCKHVVNAHEHQTRRIGKCWIPGNQIPTSVSDCLGSKAKSFIQVDGGEPRLVQINSIAHWYAEIDWRSPVPTQAQFVRMVGTATADEAVLVATAVADYRRSSQAFVVANAVVIDSVDGADVAQSLEQVEAFDVMGALREILSPEDMKTLESLK